MLSENSGFKRLYHTYETGETSKDASSSNKKVRPLREIVSVSEAEVHQSAGSIQQFFAEMRGKMRIFGFSDLASYCKDDTNGIQYEHKEGKKQEDFEKVSSQKSEAEKTDHPDEHMPEASSSTDNQRSQAMSSQDIEEIRQKWNKDAERMTTWYDARGNYKSLIEQNKELFTGKEYKKYKVMLKKRQEISEKAHSSYMSKALDNTTRWELTDKDTKEITEIANGLTRVLKEKLEKELDSLMKPERLRDFFNLVPLIERFQFKDLFNDMESKYKALLQGYEKFDGNNNPDKYAAYFKNITEFKLLYDRILPINANIALIHINTIRVKLQADLQGAPNNEIVRSNIEKLDQTISFYEEYMKRQQIYIEDKLSYIKAAGGKVYRDTKKAISIHFSFIHEEHFEILRGFHRCTNKYIKDLEDGNSLNAHKIDKTLSIFFNLLSRGKNGIQRQHQIIKDAYSNLRPPEQLAEP